MDFFTSRTPPDGTAGRPPEPLGVEERDGRGGEGVHGPVRLHETGRGSCPGRGAGVRRRQEAPPRVHSASSPCCRSPILQLLSRRV